MSKELIVSVNGREKKIAILEDDVVTEFYVERGDENQGIVGNIYKGRVMKVLPGMQSAFVDIGLERDSFLYVSDFFDEEMEEEIEEVREPQARPERTPERAERGERERSERSGRNRQAREIVVPAAVPVLDEEQEFDLAAEAISHIEDLTEEPVLEPAPGDEMLTASAAIITGDVILKAMSEPEAREPRSRRERDARVRRRDRLRVAEPEEAAIAEPVIVPHETTVLVEAEAETAELTETSEDESPARRRRRRRRRPVAGGEAAEAGELALETDGEAEVLASESDEFVAAEDLTATDTSSSSPIESDAAAETHFVIVHHNPFERIQDDDDFFGDSLKDALVQERIAERIRAEEFQTRMLDVEPTPEVAVGSLTGSLVAPSGFERISDGEDEEAPASQTKSQPVFVETVSATEVAVTAELPTELVNTAAVAEDRSLPATDRAADDISTAQWGFDGGTAVQEIAQPATEPATEEEAEEVSNAASATGTSADAENASAETVEAVNAEVAEAETVETEVVVEEPPAASASVRQRSRRGEMVTRRGGRGRRRQTNGSYRQRTGAMDATQNPEDEEDHDNAEEESAPSYHAPSARSSSPSSRESSGGRYQRPVITDLLREGQEIIVQIAKEPIGQKGARITSHVALPGRYIVYMPTVEHIGVSRKIGTDDERLRLKRTLQQLRAEAGATGGFIVRTAANGCSTEDLREDVNYLLRTWSDIRRRSDRAKAPAIVHRDLDLVQRILRDQMASDFNAIRVDNEFEYERIVDFVSRFAPKLVNRVKLYTKDTPILEQYSVQPEIDKAVKPRVWLKSGGYIVINQTEALVAIDVNTGKFVGKSNRLEDTIVKTNLEAAKEIVRQIRLRDLGGIIVLDFIDMEERRNRLKVLQALEHEMRADKAPSKILQFNDFGLVAVTRKRVKQSLERTLCTPCANCGGGGMVKSGQTVAYEILAEARSISKEVDDANEVILRVHPEVAAALRTSERDVLQEIEAYLGGIVSIKSDPSVHQEQFDIALS